MKVVVIGANGTIGTAVAAALAARHEVLGTSRRGPVKVDTEDAGTIRQLFDRVPDIDAVVCCAGAGSFGPLGSITDGDFELALRSKLMGQVNLVRIAQSRIRDRGSITLTSGMVATRPMPGSAVLSLVNAGVDGFVRAAALEMPRGIRVNAVSPTGVKETLQAMGIDSDSGVPARDVARAYIDAVEGDAQGRVLEVLEAARR